MPSRRVFYDGWDLANSAAWDARWTTTVGGGGTINVQSGGGRASVPGTLGGFQENAGGSCGRLVPNGNVEITFDFTWANITSESYGTCFVGDSHSSGGVPVNGLGLYLEPSVALVAIQRYDNGGGPAATTAAFTYSTALHRCRWRREGANAAVKVWLATNPEPTDWTLTVSEDLYRGPDYSVVMCGMFSGNVAGANSITFDNFNVYQLIPGRPVKHRLFTRKGIIVNQRSPMHLLAR